MALTGSMKTGDIPGESQIANHEGEIDFIDIKMTVKRKLEEARGQGRSVGRALVSPITLVRKLDIASPDLMNACLIAKSLETVELFVRKDSGDDPLDYLTITLENTMITRVETTGIDPKEEDSQTIFEEVDMVFDSITCLYVAQDDSHAAGDEREFTYDLRSGT